MMTPRNSVSGAFLADSIKGPSTVQLGQKTVLRRGSQLQSPTLKSFFRRESKALGAVQIMIGLFHFGLGGVLLMVPMSTYAPICVTVWYPFWGGIIYITSGSFLVAAENTSRSCLVNTRLGMNAISLFSSISGVILLIMDIFNLTVSHFLKLQSLNLGQMTKPYINIYNCQQNDPLEQSTPVQQQYCLTVKSLFLGILAVMLIFTFLQNFLVACIAEDEWKTLCSGARTSVLLLSAEERKEQTVQLTMEPSQPKGEEDMETFPAQEEDKETSFPDPPQESSPTEEGGSP
ncbi:B-lymphocyte antigen CD20 [Dromiciops gliroides]|uniref:B-lymphocyte antigen CD20 n=1 Tax=Dromiciops gliroides TaxID=33562 RepID=UPI001CC67D5E|nr:B-lymphocyte antigen CD20 [Dromiciops gliroides]